MKIKIRFRHPIAKFLNRYFGMAAITLYPYILYSRSAVHHLYDDPASMKHEFVHVEQIRRDGWFVFYTTYLYHWVREWLRGTKWLDAYYKIPYEVEAYKREIEPFTRDEYFLRSEIINEL